MQARKYKTAAALRRAITDRLKKIAETEGVRVCKCPAFSVISREQQFAEKIHAYSFPFKDRTNSRVRDLVDLVILIRDGKLSTVR